MQFIYHHFGVFPLLVFVRAISSLSILFSACTRVLGCHSPRTQNRSRQNHCSALCETLTLVSSIIKVQISLQSFIVTFISAAWPFECTNQPDNSESLHGCNIPDARTLQYCYHKQFSGMTREYFLSFTALKMCHIGVCWTCCSEFRPHSSERKSFHMFCFLTDSFGHSSETWLIARHQASMAFRSAGMDSPWLSQSWERLWRYESYFSHKCPCRA